MLFMNDHIRPPFDFSDSRLDRIVFVIVMGHDFFLRFCFTLGRPVEEYICFLGMAAGTSIVPRTMSVVVSCSGQPLAGGSANDHSWVSSSSCARITCDARHSAVSI